MSTPRFQLVPGSRLPGASGRGGIGWRLLGANNRELGRGATAFRDADAAREGVARARVCARSAASEIHHDATTGLWTWSLLDEGDLVAVSGRGFRHERECRYNLGQFRDTAPTAPALSDAPESFPWQRVASVPGEVTS